jgi:prepilin-type N-terminal cleavage/methylation domain-containing protein
MIPEHRAASDEGFGLIEIVVAMLILAVLSLSALPVLIGSMRLTALDSSVTTATGMVSEQMTLARAQTATCAALTSFAATAVPTVTDGAGRVLTVAKTTTCPATYPGTVTFTVKVTVSGSGNTVATATTLIYAGGA